jgi:2-oxoglutarate ferredoxin oxidoreductase subunit alpha
MQHAMNQSPLRQPGTRQMHPDSPPIGRHKLKGAIVRFAGDSGDGMQVVGTQFTTAAALAGNDLATFPDYPAEIRAPAGTPFGVSAFQVNFASEDVFTPGDAPDVLVAMNPAALKTNLRDVRPGGLLVVNTGSFTAANLKKAQYDASPLEDGSLDGYGVLAVDIAKLTLAAVREVGLGAKEAARCKNFWALGLTFWLYDRTLDATLEWIEGKFSGRPELARANALALRAGHAYGETVEAAHFSYEVPAAQVSPGTYRNIGGNTALSLGLLAAAELSGLELVLGAYPITPASDILHELSAHRGLGVTTVQAEDEIAAVCLAVGASYAGQLGITTTSGPGMALKTEALGLAVAVELPLVVVNIQRGGPSTGLPTKTEQADLNQALFGRNGEAPACVLAAATPGDCFYTAIEAVRIATRFMTPVIILSDGYLANGAEPWRIPDLEDLPRIEVKQRTDPDGFHPFLRDEATLARPWAVPGTPGLMHRIGGLEKDHDSGHISYDPVNHDRMSHLRAEKIARIASDLPPAEVCAGSHDGDLLVIGWGSTFGAIHEAVRRCLERDQRVSHLHLRHLNPLPRGLGDLCSRFDRILVPELNLGQLARVLQAETLRSVTSFPKMEGQPFKIDEIDSRIQQVLGGSP